MRIDITFRNLAPSEALRAYARDKIGRSKRFLPKMMDAQVTLTVDGFRNIAEAKLRGGGASFTAKESSKTDMYAAIDLLSDKVAKQAKRHKERKGEHRGGRVAAVAPDLSGDGEDDE